MDSEPTSSKEAPETTSHVPGDRSEEGQVATSNASSDESGTHPSASDQLAKEEAGAADKQQTEKAASATDEPAEHKNGGPKEDGNRASITEPGDGNEPSSASSSQPPADRTTTSMESDAGPIVEDDATKSSGLSPHHSFKMLEEVLEQPPEEKAKRIFKQHMFFDVLLGFGLLVAVAGFTIGMMRIYVTHMAKQSINQHNYKAAISMLKKDPVPELFEGFGADPNDLLNQALYLEAMEKLDANPEDPTALAQLGKISAGSRYFPLAQEILDKNTVPSELKLQGGTSHFANPEEINVPAKKPLFEELKKDLED
ncbi:MAG: hypothetical protein K2Z81_19270 [Cyanobacteria bacterium]|nr:hypothetical protein [Cyanobacteriota bacterium]